MPKSLNGLTSGRRVEIGSREKRGCSNGKESIYRFWTGGRWMFAEFLTDRGDWIQVMPGARACSFSLNDRAFSLPLRLLSLHFEVFFCLAGTLTLTWRDGTMMTVSACLEEHFPHSMANAVVEEARRRNLHHEERHAKVEYLVAHGIASSVNGEQVRIGSAHFIFEDEKCVVPEAEQDKFDMSPAEYVASMRREGHTVLMVGDGINDSPALSEENAGIAISDGAAIAREIADITIAADSLWELVRLWKRK